MKSSASQLLVRSASLGVLATYLTFGDGNLRVWDWQHVGSLLRGDSQAAWQFLMLNGRLSRPEADRLFGASTVQSLVDGGIARSTRSGVSLGKAVLMNYHRRAFFAELSPDPRAMFSEDAKALVSTLPHGNYRRCLSLYSGCGIETLVLNHRPGNEVVFVNPEADPSLLELNWQLNGLAPLARFAKEKRLDPAWKFDLVLARIPSWSLPDDLGSEMFGPGGVDGLKEIRRCFDLVGRRLDPKGTFCFTGILYGGETLDAAWSRFTEIGSAQGLSISAICSSKQVMEPGIPLFNHLLGYLEYRTKLPARVLMEKLVNHFGDQKISHAYFFRGTARRDGSAPALLDLSERYYGNWSI